MSIGTIHSTMHLRISTINSVHTSTVDRSSEAIYIASVDREAVHLVSRFRGGVAFFRKIVGPLVTRKVCTINAP